MLILLLDFSTGNVPGHQLQIVLAVEKGRSFCSQTAPQNASQKNQFRFLLSHIFLSDLDSLYIICAVPSIMIISTLISASFLAIDAFHPSFSIHSINQSTRHPFITPLRACEVLERRNLTNLQPSHSLLYCYNIRFKY